MTEFYSDAIPDDVDIDHTIPHPTPDEIGL
jgi:hypothetical protein